MEPNTYENFRSVLLLNLCTVIDDSDTMRHILEMVDITLSDFEITRKKMDIIPATDFPEAVKAYIASKWVANLSKKTLKQYQYKLQHFFDTVRKSFTDVTANDIRFYLNKYKFEHNASDCYLDNIRVTLNTFFQWLVDNEYLLRNPCAKVDKIKYQKKRRQPLSTLSLENLRWNCKNVREKALIDFLYSTGCRVSECADVLLSDINWDNNSIHIRHGKGDKERVVYFNDESKVSLQEYLKSRNDQCDTLWVSVKAPHNKIKEHALENIVRKIGKRIEIHAYPHKFRHTFATVGLRNGIPLDKLQELMGHADPKTTLIYAKQDNSQLQIEHKRAFG